MRKMNQLKRCAAMLTAAVLLAQTAAALAAEGVVNTSSLVLRKSASKSSKALQTLDKGDEVDVISAKGDWYKVSYGKYTGYVMKKYVKVSGSVSEASSEKKEDKLTIDDLGDPPATTRPGDKGKDVKKLQQALQIKGLYTGKIDGVYGEGTTEAVKAFQKKHGLSRDGIAGKVTIRTLFGKSAADADEVKTESLKWFGNEDTIPKGATVSIKDCYTGKVFKAVRWSGANHMDTEPASKEDTAIIKEIYGGSWSWRRRPILVKYDGHVYAASMNGMPHGTSTIDNGFDGHFCVHFTGSKTHETDRVDEDHQSCVKTALKYTW